MQPAGTQVGGNPIRNANFPGSMRPWEVAFVVILAAAMLGMVWMKCRRTYLSHDEIITALLVGKTSLGNLLAGIRNGTETNPPLFFILEWCIARVGGNGDLAMCALSGVGVALAVPVLHLTLRRVMEPRLAALAVGLVFGLSRDVYLFGTWARYYGWMVLLASLMAWCFIRSYTDVRLRRRDYVFVFLIHTAVVYSHLFGLFFSGMVLATHLVMDWFNGKLRWRCYGALAASWAAFGLWAPALPRQLSVTKDGTFTPRVNVGTFFEELAMQTPLAVILLLIGVLVLLAWLAADTDEAPRRPASGTAVAAMVTLAAAWLFVAVGAWAASNVMKPFFMRRYVAPCVVAWVLLVGVLLLSLHYLARQGPKPARSLPGWLPGLAWVGVLGFCVIWQPLRAWKEPAKPAAAFVDADHGHTRLPIVFEDPMDYLPRAHYGIGRDYVLLLEPAAAQASSGYYTKLNENYYRRWRAYYPELRILNYDELPAWPDGFLAVDDPLAQTFDWLFKHKRELKAERIGTWAPGKELYLVRRIP